MLISVEIACQLFSALSVIPRRAVLSLWDESVRCSYRRCVFDRTGQRLIEGGNDFIAGMDRLSIPSALSQRSDWFMSQTVDAIAPCSGFKPQRSASCGLVI